MTAFTHAGRYGPEAVIDTNGRAQKNIAVTVRTSGGALATLYTDATRATVGPNPVLTDALTGDLQFFTDPGDYIIAVQSGSLNVTVPADPRDLQGEADARAAADTAETTRAQAAEAANTAAITAEATARAAGDALLVPLTQRGAANGVATLDGAGTVPDGQIPAGIARDTEVSAAVAALVNSAPLTLDTLKELADALGDDPNFATTVTNLLAGKAQKLTRTAVKTANYTAAVGDLVPVDTTTAAVTITLPNAPAVGSRVAVKLVTLGAGHAVTIACAGSDVFNKTGGPTSGTLTLLNQALQVQYDTGGIWTVVADDLPKSALDGAYAPLLHGVVPRSVVPTPPPDLTFLTTFQAGHGWTSSGGSGSPTLDLNDATDAVLGSQCVHITGGAGAGFQGVKHLALTAVDMTSRHIALLVKVDDLSKLSSVQLYQGDTALANFDLAYCLTTGAANGGATILPGQWTWVYLTPGERLIDGGSTTGTPTRTAVTDWQIRVNFSGPVNFYLNAIGTFAAPSAFPNGVITIGFDDSFISQYTLARPVLDKYLYPASLATIVDQVGASGHLTLAQLQEMRDVHNHEVIAHAYTQASHDVGLDTIDPTVADGELKNTKGWLLDNGFYRGADYLSWPRGQHTNAVDLLARQYYRLARNVQQYVMPSPRVDQPMSVRAFSPLNTDSVATVETRIDAAFTGKAWLHLVFHDLTTAASGLTSTQYKQADFQTIVDYIATKGMPVRTYSQVVQALG